MTEQEKFEQWYTKAYPNDNDELGRSLAFPVWQAGATEKDKEISELKAKLDMAIAALEKVKDYLNKVHPDMLNTDCIFIPISQSLTNIRGV